MYRTMLKSKIHRAKVTGTKLYYEGSIAIDSLLLDAANILPGEKVEVLNLNNGARLETYAIVGKKGSGEICLNGPSARFACEGDEVIILAYGIVSLQKQYSKKKRTGQYEAFWVFIVNSFNNFYCEITKKLYLIILVCFKIVFNAYFWCNFYYKS